MSNGLRNCYGPNQILNYGVYSKAHIKVYKHTIAITITSKCA